MLKPFLKKLSLSLFAMLAMVLFMEGGLRIRDGMHGLPPKGRTFWYWLYEQDPYLGYRGRPGASLIMGGEEILHNEDGFRESHTLHEIRESKTRRWIIALGESSTYGLAAGRQEASYPSRLEFHLQTQSGNKAWAVYNAGMPGYCSFEVLQLLRIKILKYKPEAVIIMCLRNDHEFVCQYMNEEQHYNQFPLRLAQLSKTPWNEFWMKSELYGFFATKFRPCFGDDLGGKTPRFLPNPPTAEGCAFYLDNLAFIQQVCREAGVTLMFVDEPIHVAGYPPWKVESTAKLRGLLHSFCAANKITLLKAHSELDYQTLKVQDDVHLGPAGYNRLAEVIAPQVLKSLPSSP